MFRAALALAALAVFTAPQALARPAEALRDIRVCTKAQFDTKRSECKEDEAAAGPLRSLDFYCSAKVDLEVGQRVELRFLASGETVVTKSLTATKNARTAYIYVFRSQGTIFGDRPLIGGPWECRITAAGQTIRRSFRSSGPTQLVLAPKACSTKSTRAEAGWTVCAQDQSGSVIHSPEVTCSAAVAGAKGRLARVDLLRSGKQIAQVSGTIGSIGQPLSAKWTGLTAGSYSCRFSLNGKAIVSKSFRVG